MLYLHCFNKQSFVMIYNFTGDKYGNIIVYTTGKSVDCQKYTNYAQNCEEQRKNNIKQQEKMFATITINRKGIFSLFFTLLFQTLPLLLEDRQREQNRIHPSLQVIPVSIWNSQCLCTNTLRLFESISRRP